MGVWTSGKVELLPLFWTHPFVSDYVRPRTGEPLFSILLCDDHFRSVFRGPDDDLLMVAITV